MMSRCLFLKFQFVGVDRWRTMLCKRGHGSLPPRKSKLVLCVQAKSQVCVLGSEAWATKHRFLFGQ